MGIEFVIKDANGKVELDLTSRIGAVEGTQVYPIQNGKQGTILKQLGPSNIGIRYWAYPEMPNMKGRRYNSGPYNNMMYPLLSVLVVTQADMLASPSSIYKNLGNQMIPNYYYLVVIDEREAATNYDASLTIHYGRY